MFKDGKIEGLTIKDIKKYSDKRGWLVELFRQDEIKEDIHPVMSYVSMTLPNVTRGSHEHKEQTDYFAFLGPSNFKLILWDNRPHSLTFKNKMELVVGEDNPKLVIIPPGVVHAYKNIGKKPGLVLNFPNRLYAGWGKKEKVDEIRYENDPNSPYNIDQ